MPNLFLLFGWFPGHLLNDFCIDISTFGTSKSRFSHRRYCKNRFLVKIAFNRFRAGFLMFFDSLGSFFSDFFNLENRSKTEGFF